MKQGEEPGFILIIKINTSMLIHPVNEIAVVYISIGKDCTTSVLKHSILKPPNLFHVSIILNVQSQTIRQHVLYFSYKNIIILQQKNADHLLFILIVNKMLNVDYLIEYTYDLRKRVCLFQCVTYVILILSIKAIIVCGKSVFKSFKICF